MTPTPPRAQTPRGSGEPKFLAPWIRGPNLHMHTKFHPNRSTQSCSAASSHSEDGAKTTKSTSPRVIWGPNPKKNFFSIFHLRTCSGTLFKHSERKKNFRKFLKNFQVHYDPDPTPCPAPQGGRG